MRNEPQPFGPQALVFLVSVIEIGGDEFVAKIEVTPMQQLFGYEAELIIFQVLSPMCIFMSLIVL